MKRHSRQALKSITTIYLLLPALLFAWGWLKFPFSLISAAFIIIFTLSAILDLKRTAKGLQQSINIVRNVNNRNNLLTYIGLAFLLIMIWLLFSGAGGFGYQNADYKASNALLKDLIVQDWPPTLVAGEIQKPIVYYMAYYLPAAAVGKVLGWVPANLFLFIWTLFGALLAFIWFWRHTHISLRRRTTRIIGLAVVFCLAGGLDYFGYYVLKERVFDLANHIDVWAGYFQYSSNTTLMFWVPQQVIAGWLLISIIIDNIKQIQDVKYVGIVTAACILWSPFSVLGSIPYLVFALWRYLAPKNRKLLFNRWVFFSITASFWIGTTHILYILSNQFKFPAGLLLSIVENDLRYIQHLFAFWFIEYGFVALIVILFLAFSITVSRPAIVDTLKSLPKKWFDYLQIDFNISKMHFSLFLLCVVLLTILPLFTMGANNDLVMRASIPSLFIFWTFVIKVLMDAPIRARIRAGALHVLLVTLIVLGFFSSVSETFRSIKKYRVGPPEIADVLVTSDLGDRDIDQRSGSENSFFFRNLGK